jgi:hypothetical protein
LPRDISLPRVNGFITRDVRNVQIPGLLIGFLLLLNASAAPAQGSAVAGASRGPEVRSVEVVGAGEVPPEVISRVLATRTSRCRSPLLAPACALGIGATVERAYLDEAQLGADEERLRALHLSYGYPAARVNAEVTRLPRGGVAVRFITWPGEPIIVRSVVIRGLEELPFRIDLPPLPLVAGDRLALTPLETAQRIIAGRLAADGYAFAQVGVPGPFPEAGGPYDLVLEVRTGPLAVFGSTTIHTESPLTAADVSPYLAYESGQRFSPASLERTVERLYRVPIIERVHVQPAPSEDGDNRVHTDIFVTTGEPRGLQLEGAVSSSACVAGVTGWTDRYFLDQPRTVSVSAGASNLLVEPLRRFPCAGAGQDEFAKPDFFVRADLTQPLGPDTWMNIGGGFSRESSPRAFIQSGVIGRISLVHELRRGLDVTLAYSPEHRDNPTSAPLYCGIHGICTGEGLSDLTSRNTLAPVELAIAFGPPRARRIDPGMPLLAEWTYPPLPEWTYSGRVSLLGAARPTLSDFDFARLIVEGTFTRYPGRLFQLAGRARGGVLLGGGPLPPQVRLFGGGPFGVRGLEPNLLGPRILTVSPVRVEQIGCAPMGHGCEGVVVDPSLVQSRPIGGTSILEASLEGRVWASSNLQIAVFTDLGLIRIAETEDAPARFSPTRAVLTPGAGILALTPLGPFRIDLAYNPTPRQRYPLFTHDEETGDQVHLGDVFFDPISVGDPSALQKVRRRMQLQLSMRQPF